MKTGIGFSNSRHSIAAGRESASMARSRLNGAQPAWAMAFCGGQHDPDEILSGVRGELGSIPIAGGAAVGVITNESLGYTGFECAVAVFSTITPQPAMITVDGLERSTRDAGKDLGRKLQSVAKEGSTVVLFYDSIQSSPPPVLHVGSHLLEGIYDGLAGLSVKIVGAGTLGDFSLTSGYIFDGSAPLKHAATAVVFPPSLDSHTVIMHGCIPVSSFYEITRIEGPVLYELDGRPALDVIRQITGGDLPLDHPSLSVTLGEKHGDPFAPYSESVYINRLILTSNPADGSVVLFEADFREGTKIQIMSRDNQKMAESVQTRTKAFLASLGPQQPLWSLYIDCAGRSCAFSGSEVEEATLLQEELGGGFPLLGFYSGVEIAPFLGRSRPLDWTGVLTAFVMKEDSQRDR